MYAKINMTSTIDSLIRFSMYRTDSGILTDLYLLNTRARIEYLGFVSSRRIQSIPMNPNSNKKGISKLYSCQRYLLLAGFYVLDHHGRR